MAQEHPQAPSSDPPPPALQAAGVLRGVNGEPKPLHYRRIPVWGAGVYEFLGTKGLQGQPTVAPYAPLTAGPNSTLSQRYGPAIIPQELVAENGLFQPKLILA